MKEEPQPMNIRRAFHSMAINCGKIYVFGGSIGEQNEFRDTPTVEVYDPEVRQWKFSSDMPAAISTSCAVTLTDNIFVIGGQKNIFKDRVKEVYMYDCDLNKWDQRSSMNIPRAFHSATVLNNKIYIIGGRENPEEISVKTRDSLAIYTIEEYDPENDKWIVKTTMPFKHFTIGAVTIKDKIYILSDTADNRMLDKVSVLEEYDPVNNQFKSLASLPRSRCDAAMVCINDKIVVLGGWYNDALSFVDEYDPKSGCWTKKPDSKTRIVFYLTCRRHLLAS
jgi:N-acetylneuraminic acid mutarotase